MIDSPPADLTLHITNFTTGPVGQTVKQGYANTASDFQNLANSRQRPDEKTATGQQLTRTLARDTPIRGSL